MCGLCWWGARFATNIHAFCWLISLAAFGIDLTLGATWASCQDIGRRHAAVVAASMNMIGTFGSALAGWVTGTIVERGLAQQATDLGIQMNEMSAEVNQAATVAGFDTVFSTYAAIYIVAAICWLAINPSNTIESST